MTTLTIGVSGINASDNPTPGIGILKSLRETGQDYRLFGLAYDALEPGIYLDKILNKAFLIPYLSASKQEFIDRLKTIKDKHGLDILIPTLDSEMPLFIRYQEELKALGIKMFLPTQAQFAARHKDKLFELGREAGFTVPKQKVIGSTADLMSAIESVEFPVMIKGSLYQAVPAYSIEEAFSACNKIVRQWGYPIIIQRRVEGEGINLVGFGDGNGCLTGHVSMKKLSMTELGKVWTGVSICNEDLLTAAVNFVRHTKWRGAFEFECIANGKSLSLIEINPRFPAWIYFATALGVNLPQMLMDCLLGKPVEAHNKFQAGKLYIRYTDEYISDMTTFQNIVTRGES